MSVNYQAAFTYSKLAGELNETFRGLVFSDFPDVEPKLFFDASTDTQVAAVTVDSGTGSSGTSNSGTGSSGTSTSQVVVVFRGTEGLDDWKTNVQFSRKFFEVSGPRALGATARSAGAATTEDPTDSSSPLEHIRPVDPDALPNTDLSGVAPRARMHEGFTEAYISVQDELHRYIPYQNRRKLTLVGHSLGGALATLCAVDFQLTYPGRFDIELYTFGSPRVGNADFRKLFNENIPNAYRFVNGLDIVPSAPPWWYRYRHVDTEYRIGRRLTWRVISARLTDHFIRAYMGSLKELI